ncbi:MAG: hypothetical protein Q9219_004785 [cf. Caloplaca sp. 3 TL-2023]
MISLFLFSLLLNSLANAIPRPQRANRHRHGVDQAVQTTIAVSTVVEQPTTTQVGGVGNGAESAGPSAGSGTAVNIVTRGNAISTPVTSPSRPTSTGNGKRGLAYNSTSPSLTVFSNTDITWIHDWDAAPGNAPSQFMFVPTLWSDKSPHSDNWDQKAAGHQYLMSFNEPDIVGQANMDVGYALDKYKRLMFPKRSSNVKIGAPSVSSGSGNNEAGIPMGTGWLDRFLDQCNDDRTCQADFVSGHWYGCPSGSCSVQDDISSFKSYVNSLVSSAKGREVWIPEFQRYGDTNGQKQFLEGVLPTLDGNGAVTRYAYFMVADGILTTGGQVSELGNTYVA